MAKRNFLAVTMMLVVALPFISSCSISMVVNRVGDELASGPSVYATDDDPEFVGQALPFGLKTTESLLAQSPRHPGLLLAACRGFTQYAYVYLQSEADFIEEQDLPRAVHLRERAARMYRRALGYGIRGLEVRRAGSFAALQRDPVAVAASFGKEDLPLIYWTAMSLAASVAVNKNNTELVADLPIAEALMRRARDLDESYDLGSIHDFFIAYDGGRPAAGGGSVERARRSLEKALEYAQGRRAAPLVSFAETVDVGSQDRAEFEKLLNRALAIDPNAAPEQRLANLIAQRRARWLLARKDRLFIE